MALTGIMRVHMLVQMQGLQVIAQGRCTSLHLLGEWLWLQARGYAGADAYHARRRKI